ncbi:unnamed protein product [Rotaria sp. Silwood1]|nr:unnamed protein product [Rotaria sp. Silwood1]CAF3565742.1 unnamed protein product [Rotaria sp. Silwood1]CAF3588145.1 unnamed protein product [Rotaria sp. Silwood1]CAF4828652.1 unnamed protein product [Rotaria sp. Silwood1]CAF4873444.1 unnamed protein product [Rotaria sp. Silwood1]
MEKAPSKSAMKRRQELVDILMSNRPSAIQSHQSSTSSATESVISMIMPKPGKSAQANNELSIARLWGIAWMWKANIDPWSSTEPDEWKNYSDIENMIIEEAFMAEKDIAILDDYHIIFSNNVQINNNNTNNQRPVQRIVMGERGEQRLREARFMPNPIKLNASFRKNHVFTSTLEFVRATREKFQFQCENLEDELPTIVEYVALGLIIEGKLVDKKCEAEWMAEQLRKMSRNSKEVIEKCCARLYTMESFLYQKLNEAM